MFDPPKLLIWDFDGTIADTATVIVNTFTQVFTERNLGLCDPAAVRALIGIPLGGAFARLVPRAGDDDGFRASLVRDYRRVFAQRAPTEAQAFPGMVALIEALGDAGRTQAIATGRGRTSLDDLMDRFAIADRFAAVVTPEDVSHAKPDPEMVRNACTRLSVDPRDAIVIGDTAYDITMGRSAGARTCGVTWGNQTADALIAAGADRVVDDPDELAASITY